MTTTAFLPVPIFRAFTSAGLPLAGGLLYTYAAGTTNPQATYSDAAGVVPNANPVVLDSTGSATVRLGTSAYKFVLKDSGGTTQWTEDNYLPIGDSPVLAGTVTVGVLSVTGNASVGGNASVTGTLSVTGQTTLTGDTLARGVAVCKFKAADTARQSTTTPANDPDLAYAIPSTGTYQIELGLVFDSVAAGAGFKFGLTFSGTAGGTPGVQFGYVNSAAYGPVTSGGIIGGTNVQGTVSTVANEVILNFTVSITVIGTLNVQWAQNSSTASNTTLRTGSFLKVTKLS